MLFFMPLLLLLSLLPLSLFLSLILLVTACRFHMCQCSDNCYLLCNTTHSNDRKYITSAVIFHLKCKNQFGSMHPREGNALPITTKPQDTAKLASNLWSDNLLYPCLSHFCWCHFIKRCHISVIASTIWLFFQQLVQANNKEITKARHNWSCVRGNQPVRVTMDSPHKGPLMREVFIYHDVIMCSCKSPWCIAYADALPSIATKSFAIAMLIEHRRKHFNLVYSYSLNFLWLVIAISLQMATGNTYKFKTRSRSDVLQIRLHPDFPAFPDRSLHF